ncbi:F-box/kelch-repeat protein At3g23880-like [Impatiens glandulifera]|uniref:F-box/kelch-repeat protein At3g23880-like n=1 Tax=Impatiens glandulifera TaxID=253017 RepID=UPI001FB0C1E4|nr:F-box/kelch-repeat protein At3g23880-like [Impatiens glandulifera]
MNTESEDPTTDHFHSDHLDASLPTEIIIEILIKLPVKFLLKFMCVCRSWRALISDPIFVKKHLKASTKNEDYAHHKIIINSRSSAYLERCSLEWCSLSSVLHEESHIDTHVLDYPLKNPKLWVGLVGSLNGLVCIVIENSVVFLWNPSTKISKRLPHSGIIQRPSQDVSYGFGYDEGSSEYKVVVIYTELKVPEYSFETEVKIYGLKSDSWKTVEDYPNCTTITSMGVFVSGSLHWDSDMNMGFNKY